MLRRNTFRGLASRLPLGSRLLVVIGAVLAVGIAVLLVARAAGVFVAMETENGTLGGSAKVNTEGAASGGKAVEFSAPATHSSDHWLMTTSLIDSFSSSDMASAQWFFNTTGAFAMSTAASGMAATVIQNYKSYQQFSSDLSTGAFPSGVHWVMYDNENWSYTPTAEAQHPAQYMKQFADLAHQHNLSVLEVPARDLMNVTGADCWAQAGETIDQAYIRCGIPGDAQYADIYEIQAQADQSNVTDYVNLVTASRSQVLAKAPGITLMAGLTTDRNDTVAAIVNCWKASHTYVSGYWMNSGSTTMSVAEQAMDQIRASGG